MRRRGTLSGPVALRSEPMAAAPPAETRQHRKRFAYAAALLSVGAQSYGKQNEAVPSGL